MTSPTGEVQLSQRFPPFGEVKEKYGDGEANFGYAGQKYDAQTGLLYLRARYYAPGTGRFISHDTWSGDANMPMSYNAWLYGYGNPVKYTDPFGLYPHDNPNGDDDSSLPCKLGIGIKYCKLQGEWDGLYIDIDHWDGGYTIAETIDKEMNSHIGLKDSPAEIKASIVSYRSLHLEGKYHYIFNMKRLDEREWNEVLLGIFMDVERNIEDFQAISPLCYLVKSGQATLPVVGLQTCSGYANEDLPSDYLGYLTYINRYETIPGTDIVMDRGDLEGVIEGVFGESGIGVFEKTTDTTIDVDCIINGNCDENTSYNDCRDFKPFIDGTYKIKQFPHEYIYTPRGKGVYWDWANQGMEMFFDVYD